MARKKKPTTTKRNVDQDEIVPDGGSDTSSSDTSGSDTSSEVLELHLPDTPKESDLKKKRKVTSSKARTVQKKKRKRSSVKIPEVKLPCNFCRLSGSVCSYENPCNRCSEKNIQCFYSKEIVYIEEGLRVSLCKSCDRCQSYRIRCSGDLTCESCTGAKKQCLRRPQKVRGIKTGLPCIHCAASNSECSYDLPCTSCTEKKIKCSYVTRAEGKKMRKSCERCTRLRAKCDGGSPCRRCLIANAGCVYAERRRAKTKSCDYCVAIKARCSGGHPCINCTKRGIECTNGVRNKESIALRLKEIRKKELRLKELKIKGPASRKRSGLDILSAAVSNEQRRTLIEDNYPKMKDMILSFLNSTYVKVSKDPDDILPRNSLLYCPSQVFMKTLKYYLGNFYEKKDESLSKSFSKLKKREFHDLCRESFEQVGLGWYPPHQRHTKMWYGLEVNTNYYFGVNVNVRSLVPEANSLLEASKKIGNIQKIGNVLVSGKQNKKTRKPANEKPTKGNGVPSPFLTPVKFHIKKYLRKKGEKKKL